MSLILEALRKSEAERRRGLAPDVAMELPPSQAARPRPLAAWLVPALIVAALLVLAGWWARREPAGTAPSTAAALPASTNEQPLDPAPASASVPAVVPRARPEPPTPAIVAAPPPPAAISRAEPASPPPAAAVAARQPAPAAAEPAPARIPPPPPPAPLPASDISNDVSSLPPIKLSMLIWDQVPARRFVILNGQRMAEGDRQGEITLLTIERNGVVVEGNGGKVRVPLP